MFERLSQFLRGTKPQESEAYKLGQHAGEAVSKDVETIADQLLSNRRQNFLAVLDGRLSAIQEVEGVSYNEQARIELRVMLENWSERMPDQWREIEALVHARWSAQILTGADDLLSKIINDQIKIHYGKLLSDGLEHAADAVAIHASVAGS